MIYLLIVGVSLSVGFIAGAVYYSTELYRLTDENVLLKAQREALMQGIRDAQDTFKTTQKMYRGA